VRGSFVRTKILSTIGPATDTKEKIRDLLSAGVDGFRLNFSHGNHSYFRNVLTNISDVSLEMNIPAAVLQDLSGPKIRVGELAQPEIELREGDKIEIVDSDIHGTKDRISVNYNKLILDSVVGNRILIDDGRIKLVITKKDSGSLLAEIIQGGILKPRKGVNLPGMNLSMPALTEKDIKDLEFGLEYPVSFIALSFIRKADDIRLLRNWLKSKNVSKPIIAKIEKPEAIENFEEILSVADGIMIARGDLGVEVAPQEVPVIQKQLIKRCNQAGKLVITATQMLESMISSAVPTRAEASDIANAVIDGTDVVMLSAETSVGKYPVEAVKVMNEILLRTESASDLRKEITYDIPLIQSDNLFDAAGKAVTLIADQLKAKAIIVFTLYGRKAKVISKFRPDIKVIAISNRKETVRMLNIYYGIVALYMDDVPDEDQAIKNAQNILTEKLILHHGDLVIYTSGSPSGETGRRNWIRFETI